MSKNAKHVADAQGENALPKASVKARGKHRLAAMLEEGTSEYAVLRGRHGVSVHGCRKILLYSPEEIRLQLHRDFLSVRGEGLFCSSFAFGTVEVKGEIDGVSFLGEAEIFSSPEQEKKPKGRATK